MNPIIGKLIALAGVTNCILGNSPQGAILFVDIDEQKRTLLAELINQFVPGLLVIHVKHIMEAPPNLIPNKAVPLNG